MHFGAKNELIVNSNEPVGQLIRSVAYSPEVETHAIESAVLLHMVAEADVMAANLEGMLNKDIATQLEAIDNSTEAPEQIEADKHMFAEELVDAGLATATYVVSQGLVKAVVRPAANHKAAQVDALQARVKALEESTNVDLVAEEGMDLTPAEHLELAKRQLEQAKVAGHLSMVLTLQYGPSNS